MRNNFPFSSALQALTRKLGGYLYNHQAFWENINASFYTNRTLLRLVEKALTVALFRSCLFHVFVACLIGLILFEPSFAHAASAGGAGNAFESGLAKVVEVLNGPAARSLAAIAVIMMGVAAMFGRLDWMKAGMVVIGIAIVFGAATIVDMFAGQ